MPRQKQAHRYAPRGKRVRVVLKNGEEFVEKFFDNDHHVMKFETRQVRQSDVKSMTIYRAPQHEQKA